MLQSSTELFLGTAGTKPLGRCSLAVYLPESLLACLFAKLTRRRQKEKDGVERGRETKRRKVKHQEETAVGWGDRGRGDFSPSNPAKDSIQGYRDTGLGQQS